MENEHSVSFVLLSTVTAVAFLLISLKCSMLFILPVLGATWFLITHRDLLLRVWKTLPRDAR